MTEAPAIPPRLAEDLLHLIAAEARRPPGAVQLDARIVEDLGLSGDAAFELIRAISDRYPVDWTALRPQWHALFERRAARLEAWATGAASLAAGWGAMHALGFEPAWLTGALAGLLLWIAADRALRHWRAARGLPEPATVRDLVEAVQAGRWMKGER